eukprot:CAMPEP_0179271942 /NCGR_PEP_ID=MMETSP0797-20121207/32239_1 /TAXON_ID=47934 /ORGANISM="Dinophysis acuminata, Strain DAEP01" /LENGTH=329 /DNA_ID=CAMNT_0020980317 /DNA_START=183 /DNA_END=1172 /DNA_ORIENTATION=-
MSLNFDTARSVIQEAFAELEAQCREEKTQYQKTGAKPSLHKSNRWAMYTDKDRLQQFKVSSMDFVRDNPDCRTWLLSHVQLRFLVLLQHFVSEDTADFHRPERERSHSDVFEGDVNAQLIKDAHRSEWSVDGSSFSMQDQPVPAASLTGKDQRRVIAKFQQELVVAIEAYLLDFCGRRKLSVLGTQRLLHAVTTQMSQCGLANLDRSSQASKYFVGSKGLEQRTAYNISTMEAGPLGEALKLSMFCMKTGFSEYHTEAMFGDPGDLNSLDEDVGPTQCAPSSYLYQYATLRFAPMAEPVYGCERIDCTVIDALDEVHIEPAVEPGYGWL